MIEEIVRVTDILTAAVLVVCLNLVMKYRWAWIIYSIASLPFVAVCVYKKLFGLGIMGIILVFTGLNNYRKWKSKVE